MIFQTHGKCFGDVSLMFERLECKLKALMTFQMEFHLRTTSIQNLESSLLPLRLLLVYPSNLVLFKFTNKYTYY
jgi:hypothetical protein